MNESTTTTTLLESDDLLGSYGHHYLATARPVVDPPPQVKSDLQIVQELAARVGLADAVAGDARAWKARLMAKRLGPHGVTVDDLDRGPVKNPLARPVLFQGRRVATETGRVSLVSDAAPPALAIDRDYPLVLMSVSTEDAQASQWSRPLEGPAIAAVHPEAAAGIADGAIARLESRIGSMTVRVKHDPRQRRDVVLVPKGGHLKDGRCANVLVRARATDIGGGAAFYDEGVRLVRT
jgi:anaerobic selenocysteine-containing dehydrogenase